MCCTSAPAQLSKTHLYAGCGIREGKRVHVLAYQNHAKSRDRGPNAMILPIPAKEPMGPANVLDTRAYKRFLKDISEASRRVTRSATRSASAYAASTQVFQVGSYTVVLGDDPISIDAALRTVPEQVRPTIKRDLVASFTKNYPGWPVAVCCWSGDIEAEPLLWWYVPKSENWLFAPALDAHDGHAPVLDASVDVDHHVSFGSRWSDSRTGNSVEYRDLLPEEAEWLLPERVFGTRLHQRMANGDFWCEIGGDGNTVPSRRAFRAAPYDGAPRTGVRLDGWH
jgi:hypothetical protein